jgi:uncharacterized RDD family membrane protein YckC
MLEKIDDDSLVKIAMRQDASTLFRRWGATWIDFVVLAVGLFLITYLMVHMPAADKPGGGGVMILAWVAFVLGYYIVPEGRWGRTVGKFVTGLKVVNQNGDLPGYGASTIRTLFRLIEVNPFLVGGAPAGLVVLISKENRRLGDMAASTFVLPVKDIEQFHRQATSVFD